MDRVPYILLDDQVSGERRYYANPVDVIRVYDADEIKPAFQRLAKYQADGYYLAGYLAYEAGFIFEDKLKSLGSSDKSYPLIEFGVFDRLDTVPPDFFDQCEAPPDVRLKPLWSPSEYQDRFNRVIDYIAAGDVYQVNLTFPLVGYYAGTARSVYDCLRKRQPGEFGAIVSLGKHKIISFSPELFFKTQDATIDLRPMKGTAKRASSNQDDELVRSHLQSDPKNRAENLMIVDLLRNDVSRIAEQGSVHVPKLFHVETYPTLHQMTSQVRATLNEDTDFYHIFRALFPCGSITGAPKIRAMEIIHELETQPRGAYCGAIGYMDPNGNSCFNVAIRTLSIADNMVTYNVGSGVVIDSDGSDEYEECLLKAKILSPTPRQLPDLIETFKWSKRDGFIRLDPHLSRLKNSANSLGYTISDKKIEAALSDISADHDLRVRLSLSAEGTVSVSTMKLSHFEDPLKISISKHRLTRQVQHYDHKLSDRDFYDGERVRLSGLTGCDEVVFLNARNELCEGSFTSLFLQKDDVLYTPSLSCGLLPGVLRRALLDDGTATEKVLTIKDLLDADKIYLGNSLRGLMVAQLISGETV